MATIRIKGTPAFRSTIKSALALAKSRLSKELMAHIWRIPRIEEDTSADAYAACAHQYLSPQIVRIATYSLQYPLAVIASYLVHEGGHLIFLSESECLRIQIQALRELGAPQEYIARFESALENPTAHYRQKAGTVRNAAGMIFDLSKMGGHKNV